MYIDDIDDVMEFLAENSRVLEKVFVNFEEEFLEIISQNYTKYDVVDFVSKFYEREQRKVIIKELLNTL